MGAVTTRPSEAFTSFTDKAKQLTKKQKSFYEQGRLGMIVDGTGHEYGKIKKAKEKAEAMGYDTYMVFVNTSLEVAQELNLNRDRVLPDDLLKKSWQDVQNNLGKFKGLFGGNFEIVDNTSYEKHDHEFKNKQTGKKIKVKKPVAQQIHKALARFVNNSVQNPVGKKWIETARALKSSKMIK